MLRAIFWGFFATLFFWQGLEVVGWGFYELSHTTGIEGLYFGYSVFRGLDHIFSLWPYHNFLCLALGIFVSLTNFHLRRREVESDESS